MLDIVVSFVPNIHPQQQWHGRISKMILYSNHVNDEFHNNNDDDDTMKLSLLLKELTRRGVRFPPTATTQELRQLLLLHQQQQQQQFQRQPAYSSPPSSMRTARRELPPSRRRRRQRDDDDDNWLFSPQKRESYYSKSMNQFQKRTQSFLRNNYSRWSNNRYRNRRMDDDGIFNVDYEYTTPPRRGRRRPPMSRKDNRRRQPPPRSTRQSVQLRNDRQNILALPSSETTIRNNDPYYQAISDTILTSNDTRHHNGTSQKRRTRRTLQSRRTGNVTSSSNETKPIYSVYPDEDDEYYQDLEDLYGKTTAQVIDQFGEFLANVVSDDYDDDEDDNGPKDVKKERKNHKRSRQHWKDRVLNRVDQLLGLHEDSSYYNKWTDRLELEKEDEQEHVNALEYVQGKKKKKKRRKKIANERDQSFWEQDGTLMSLFFGRSPSGEPLQFEVNIIQLFVTIFYMECNHIILF